MNESTMNLNHCQNEVRIDEVQFAAAKYPTLRIIGDTPYVSGCYLIRKGGWNKGLYIQPVVLVKTMSNLRMLQLIEDPKFNPDTLQQDIIKHNSMELLDNGLSFGTYLNTNEAQIDLINNALNLLDCAQEIMELFIKDTVQPIPDCKKDMQMAWNAIRTSI
jgi:hypothetical protein